MHCFWRRRQNFPNLGCAVRQARFQALEKAQRLDQLRSIRARAHWAKASSQGTKKTPRALKALAICLPDAPGPSEVIQQLAGNMVAVYVELGDNKPHPSKHKLEAHRPRDVVQSLLV